MQRLNRNLLWAGALMDELARSGIQHVVVSPGSRSAPLALTAAAHPDLRDRSILDERSAGFVALGLARATGRPAALVCTSGTAAANYLPAVIEASYSHLPLVVLTADRPPEERACGTGQTIRQAGLYGPYVRLFTDLPPPDLEAPVLRHLRRAACRAASTALGPDPGPVHLNLPFREPLAPVEVAEDLRAAERLGSLLVSGRGEEPMTRVSQAAAPRASDTEVRHIAEEIHGEPRGWIVAGPLEHRRGLPGELVRLAGALRWPILADPLSGLRCGPHDRSAVIDAQDALLRCPELVEAHLPRIALRLGAMPTSKALRLVLERHPEIRQVVVDPWDWRDPTGLAGRLVRADPRTFSRALTAALEDLPPPVDSGFREAWTQANRLAGRVLREELAGHAGLPEPLVAQALGDLLPEGAALVVASSMPIRDLDLFWRGSPRELRLHANRGANGIDGTVSTALGVALGTPSPVILLTGDLALLHDWSALLGARETDLDLTVVVLANGGGGIFELLPVAESAPRDIFEQHFAAPQAVDLAAALQGFGFPCREACDLPGLEQGLCASVGRRGTGFVLVPGDRRRSRELHRKLLEAVRNALAGGARVR